MNEKEWIDLNGSPLLRRLAAEGLPTKRQYRRERLALERPGWSFDSNDIEPFREDSRTEAIDLLDEGAVEFLDRARQTEPSAKLGFIHDEYGFILCAFAEFEGEQKPSASPFRRRGNFPFPLRNSNHAGLSVEANAGSSRRLAAKPFLDRRFRPERPATGVSVRLGKLAASDQAIEALRREAERSREFEATEGESVRREIEGEYGVRHVASPLNPWTFDRFNARLPGVRRRPTTSRCRIGESGRVFFRAAAASAIVRRLGAFERAAWSIAKVRRRRRRRARVTEILRYSRFFLFQT